MTAKAELIEDGGAATADDQFFRSRPFLEAEGATHTLRIDTGDAELLAPLVVREIPGTDQRDAVSPYGYPGLVGGEGRVHPPPDALASLALGSVRTGVHPPLDPAGIDFSGTGLVSIFIRHTLGPPPLTGATERNVVQIADPTLPAKSRPSDRRQVRRNLEAGYELELVTGAKTSPEQRAAFLDAYEQTMRRTGAAEHYFFGAAYFDRVLEADRTWLALATAPDGAVAAASIAVASDGCLHYYLSGSLDSHLRSAPMKNVVTRLVEHSQELGLPLNLGGGMTAGDALEEFKRGFANRQQAWLTSELICDRTRYAELSAGREAGGFFPAYRA
ncbi:MAG TPA: GNAT family N-acetyltransferase [Solirubrobacterales bacterium]|nr:GNAT family N-acetyltransferase [Solirubrobacterales bacterium]